MNWLIGYFAVGIAIFAYGLAPAEHREDYRAQPTSDRIGIFLMYLLLWPTLWMGDE